TEAPTTEPATAPDELEAPPHIRRVPLNGQDIADLHNHRMWKFAFKLPPNEYTNYVWIEKWSREAEEPVVELLSSIYDVWDENEIVLKLASLAFPQQYVRIGPIEVRENTAVGLRIDEPYRTDIISGPSPLTPGENISLLTFTHNQNSSPTGGLEDVHRQHDVTIYVKTRFQPGPYLEFTRVPPTAQPEAEATPETSEPTTAAPPAEPAEPNETVEPTPDN
ncbi:MAG: hypothetical protein ACYTGQ_19045, partial [Planctomycetota bacterium]